MNDNVTDYGCITTTDTVNTGSWWDYTIPGTTCEPIVNIPSVWYKPTPLYQNNKKGDDNMRYLYEVILVNPKNDEFYLDRVVVRSETSALMEIYKDSPFNESQNKVKFDNLKTQCRVLMSWKKEQRTTACE